MCASCPHRIEAFNNFLSLNIRLNPITVFINISIWVKKKFRVTSDPFHPLWHFKKVRKKNETENLSGIWYKKQKKNSDQTLLPLQFCKQFKENVKRNMDPLKEKFCFVHTFFLCAASNTFSKHSTFKSVYAVSIHIVLSVNDGYKATTSQNKKFVFEHFSFHFHFNVLIIFH